MCLKSNAFNTQSGDPTAMKNTVICEAVQEAIKSGLQVYMGFEQNHVEKNLLDYIGKGMIYE